MDEYIINYYPLAEEDIKNIYSYLIENEVSEAVARKLINTIITTIDSLNVLPERYVKVETKRWINMGMHKMPIDKYVIFYSVDKLNHRVNIVRVFHQGRNLDYILESNRILVSEKSVNSFLSSSSFATQ